jgi:ParB/RepB/Spo0J family partition protein
MVLKNILIADIEPGINTRKTIDKKELDELKDSIEVSGLLQPIGVKEKSPGKYELLYGFRRLECFKQLDWKEIPAVIHITTGGASLHIIENLQRKDIPPLEMAAAIEKYKETSNLTLNDIAKIIGKSIHEVSLINKLNDLIPDLVKLLNENAIQIEGAYFIARYPIQEQKEFYQSHQYIHFINLNMIKDHFNNKYILIKSFAWAADKIFEGLPQCSKCPETSSGAENLFPEIKADTCLNQKCMMSKIQLNLDDLIKNNSSFIYIETVDFPRYKYHKPGMKIYSKGSLAKANKNLKDKSDVLTGIVVCSDTLTSIGKIDLYKKLPNSDKENKSSSGSRAGKTPLTELSPAEQKKQRIETYKRKKDLILFPMAGEVARDLYERIKEVKFSSYKTIPVEALNIIADYTIQRADWQLIQDLQKIWNPKKDKNNFGKIFELLIKASVNFTITPDMEQFAGSEEYKRLREAATVLKIDLPAIENKYKISYDEKLVQLKEKFILKNKFDPEKEK